MIISAWSLAPMKAQKVNTDDMKVHFVYVFNIYLFRLCWVLGAACGIFIVSCESFVVAHRLSSCGAWALFLHGIWDLSSPPRDWTCIPCTSAAAAKSLQSCPTLCDPPGSPVPGILQARTLEWVAISFSNAWKWKRKVKLLSRVRPSATPWTAAHQAPLSMRFSRQEHWSGVPLHCKVDS